MLGAFHRLDCAVGCRRGDAETLAHVIDRLMVQRIDENLDFLALCTVVLRFCSGVNLGQLAVGLD